VSLRVLLRQGVSYGLVGGLALLVDWGCFVALTWAGAAVVPANLLARVSGAGIAYVLNGAFTFRDQHGSRLGWRRFLRVAIAWLALTAASTLAMYVLQVHASLQWAWLAKPGVELVLAGISFLAYRHWIFR
jgi:putative flippase GtrA